MRGKTIAVWGLAFKAETDDTRNSPALQIIRRLNGLGAKIKVYDPLVKKLDSPWDSFVQYSTGMYDAARHAHAVCAKPLNGNGRRSFSVRLGVVLHFLADYFCYAHNDQRLIKHKLDHFCYELEVGKFLLAARHDFTLTESCLEQIKNLEPIELIEENHRLYLQRIAWNPANDAQFILSVCSMTALSVVSSALELRIPEVA